MLVDVILFVIEVGCFGFDDQKVFDLILFGMLMLLIVNKIDCVNDKVLLFLFMQKVSELCEFIEFVLLLVQKLEDIKCLLDMIKLYLLEGELIYGEDELIDCSLCFFVVEILCEKVFCWIGDELLYMSIVLIDKFEEEGCLKCIFVMIFVECDLYKVMVIGKKGEKFKQISIEVWMDMEKLFDGFVYFEIFVKVKSGWVDNEVGLCVYGYE